MQRLRKTLKSIFYSSDLSYEVVDVHILYYLALFLDYSIVSYREAYAILKKHFCVQNSLKASVVVIYNLPMQICAGLGLLLMYISTYWDFLNQT